MNFYIQQYNAFLSTIENYFYESKALSVERLWHIKKEKQKLTDKGRKKKKTSKLYDFL